VTLIKRPFAETFTFARPNAAQHRNAAGAVVTAAINAPRFDHEADGTAKGLLIEPGSDMGQHDALETVAGWDASVAKAMVLHEYDVGGEIVRSAFYTNNPKAMADACLKIVGHHRELIVLDGWKRNRGGYVRFDGRNWYLGGALAINPGPLDTEVLGSDADVPLIEG
jgi:hypothetical protein